MIVSGEEEEEEEVIIPIKTATINEPIKTEPIKLTLEESHETINESSVPVITDDTSRHEYQTLIKTKSESIDETDINKSPNNINHNLTLSERMLYSITSIFHNEKLPDTINENDEINVSKDSIPVEIKKEPVKKEFNSERLIQLRKANYELQTNLSNYISNFYKGYNSTMSKLLKSFENSLHSAQDASANLRSINSDLIQLVSSMQEASLYKKK